MTDIHRLTNDIRNDIIDLYYSIAVRQAVRELPDGTSDEIIERAHQIVRKARNRIVVADQPLEPSSD